MKWSQKLILVAALWVTLSACESRGSQATPTPAPTPIISQKPTYTVTRGTVDKSLEMVGRVAPVQQQDLFFRTDGYVKNVKVKRGDQVKAGDVLAELEMGTIEEEIADARLGLQSAEIKFSKALQDHLNDMVDSELSLKKADLDAQQGGAIGVALTAEVAQQKVDAAKKRYDEAKASYESAKADPKLEEDKLEERRLQFVEMERQYENAKTLLAAEIELEKALTLIDQALEKYQAVIKDPQSTEDQKTAAAVEFQHVQDGYIQAWVNYANALGGKYPLGFTARKNGIDAAVARQKAEKLKQGLDPTLVLDVTQARAKLEKALRKADNARLIAPFDGQIISLSVVSGSQVSAFKAMLTIADPTALEITVNPAPEELKVMGVGQSVKIRFATEPGVEYVGKVRLMPAAAGSSGTTVQDNLAHIDLEGSKASLVLGAVANVTIHIETRENVLWVSPAAIRTYQGRNFILVTEGGVQRRIDVRLGLQSADKVEILEGVSEGQTVVGP